GGFFINKFFKIRSDISFPIHLIFLSFFSWFSHSSFVFYLPHLRSVTKTTLNQRSKETSTSIYDQTSSRTRGGKQLYLTSKLIHSKPIFWNFIHGIIPILHFNLFDLKNRFFEKFNVTPVLILIPMIVMSFNQISRMNINVEFLFHFSNS